METILYNNILFYQIKDYKDYYISKCGKVYSNKSERCISMYKSNSGYYIIELKKRKRFLLHRLLALQFISNPENKPQVNHINGIKTDNRVENLEWCTASENKKHAFRIGLQKPKLGKDNLLSKKVIQLDLFNNKIKIWSSLMDAQRELGIGNSEISKCCKGKNKTAGGFKWKYY